MSDKDTVILLHGIGHCWINMYGIERALRKEGYDVLNVTYPSIFRDLTGITEFLHAHFAKKGVWSRTRAHFVTHSMGGVALAQYLERYRDQIPEDKLGNVVMIAPPHGGSEIADLMAKFPPYKLLFGPAGQELPTSHRKAIKPAVYYSLGIIAGTCSWPYFLANFFFKEPHDGRVSVSSTKLDGMKDHITLDLTHEYIVWNKRTNKQIVHFMRNGSFNHG